MSEKFVAQFRFGCKPNLPALGSETVVIAKIDAYGLLFSGHKLTVCATKKRHFQLEMV